MNVHIKRVIALLFACLILFSSACTVESGEVLSADGVNSSTEDKTDSAALPPDSEFYVMFIDVGQADSALVMCDGEYMLIDGGNVADSSKIYSVLNAKNVSVLKYVIGTHAHEDHIGGLAGALNACKVENVFCPVNEYGSKAFNNFKKAAEAQGKELTAPDVGAVYTLGSAVFTVLAPCEAYDDANNTSIVIRLVYGETSFLFAGDAERESEQAMLETGAELSSTLLKVGHHGSSSSTSYAFLREVLPEYAVISVGAGNDYGHPHDEIISKLNDAGVTVLRTDELGDIICKSNGKKLSFENAKNGGESHADYAYIANVNSKVLHRRTCGNLPKEENRVYFSTVEEAEAEGYTKHCGFCKP